MVSRTNSLNLLLVEVTEKGIFAVCKNCNKKIETWRQARYHFKYVCKTDQKTFSKISKIARFFEVEKND